MLSDKMCFLLSCAARLAQSVEHETLNLRVVGSSPTLGDYFLCRSTNSLRKQPSAWNFEQACHPALLVIQKAMNLYSISACTPTCHLNDIPITDELYS